MSQSVGMETDSVEENEPLGASGKGRRHPFFQRSDSTLCLGCLPPDPFETSMSKALPLADQPHLLQPNATRDDLFGIPKQPITVPPSGKLIIICRNVITECLITLTNDN